MTEADYERLERRVTETQEYVLALARGMQNVLARLVEHVEEGRPVTVDGMAKHCENMASWAREHADHPGFLQAEVDFIEGLGQVLRRRKLLRASAATEARN